MLQAAVVDVLDSRQCDALLRPWCNRHWCGLQEHQLCAGKLEGGVDACQVMESQLLCKFISKTTL
jgi:hypothetical protein